MIIVDSSVWIDYFVGRHVPQVKRLRTLLDREADLGVLDLVAMEVLQGCRTDALHDKLRRALNAFAHFECGGYERAERAARNYRRLRTTGITPRRSIDVLIATFCIDENMVLLHNDRDFEPVEKHLGLRVLKSSSL